MKKTLIIVLAVLMLVAVFAGCGERNQIPEENSDVVDEFAALNLVVDGVSDFVIVHGVNATESEVKAAKELRSYLKKISGAVLSVVTDLKKPTANEIVVGKTNREEPGDFDRDELGDDGFVIKTANGKLWLVGGETRGTLYSVYTFLEEYLGCRFYTAEIEKIPETKNIKVPYIEENKQIPVFKYRDMTYSQANLMFFPAKLKINGTYAKNLNDAYGSHYKFSPFFVHTLGWFSGTNSVNSPQPCLTDPELLEKTIKKVRNILKSDPTVNVIEISQNDNVSVTAGNYCTCENCNKVLEEEGSHAGAIIRFVNAVAAEFAEEYPNVIFKTLAYTYSQTPPKITKPAPNVAVMLCAPYCCYNHPIDLETHDPERYESVQTLLKGDIDLTADHRTDGLMDAHNIYFMKDLTAWSEICNNLIIWQYTTSCSFSLLYYPNFNTMLPNARLYADNHVIGVFDMGVGFQSADFPELRAYIMAKCLWNPYMTEEEYWGHIDDFLEGVYGPGWQEIRNYIDHTQELLEDVCCKCISTAEIDADLEWDDFNCAHLFPIPEIEELHPLDSYPEELTADMIRNYETVDWSKYWNWYGKLPEEGPDYLSYAEKCFSNAAAMAETDQQKAIIEKTSLQAVFYRSWYNLQQYRAGEGKYSAAINMLDAYFKAHPGEFTEAEQISYKDKIADLAADQAFGPSIEFNKEFIELLKKHNIDHISEGRVIDFNKDPETYDLKTPLADW